MLAAALSYNITGVGLYLVELSSEPTIYSMTYRVEPLFLRFRRYTGRIRPKGEVRQGFDGTAPECGRLFGASP